MVTFLNIRIWWMVSEYFCDGVAFNTFKCGKKRLAQFGPVVPHWTTQQQPGRQGLRWQLLLAQCGAGAHLRPESQGRGWATVHRTVHHSDRVDRWGGIHRSRGAVSREVRGDMANSKIIHAEACYNEDSQAAEIQQIWGGAKNLNFSKYFGRL